MNAGTGLDRAPAESMTATRWLDVSGIHLEGVVWDANAGRLRFVDIPSGRVFDADPESAAVAWFDLQAPVTAVFPTTDGATLVVLDGDGVALVHPGPSVERLAAPLAGRPGLRMNDGNVDPAGRLLAGSMAYDVEQGAGCLYRLDNDRSLSTVLTGVTISNGVDFSPDSTLCYFVDSPLKRIDVFDYDLSTGTLSNRRLFADTSALPGIPDGLTVDADGAVWVAFFGGGRVCRFDRTGRVTRTITVPVTQVTSCCFAGRDLDQLVISTSTDGLTAAELRQQPGAGAVFRADPGCRGRVGTRFGV
jgi:sugar lactone lactonase YvrE